jgi:hypothetical protein
MTTWTNWCCWTYFLVGGDAVSGGRIISYDLSSRTLKYYKPTGRSPKACPHPRGTADHEAWLWETVEAKYAEVWVDPNKQSALSVEDYNSVESGKKPESFIVLEGEDPQAFFNGYVSSNSFSHMRWQDPE